MDINSINDIKNIFYINLKHRKDRKEHIEQQLKNIGLTNFERFDAIKLQNGRVGCSMSHLKCLNLAKERKYEYVLICEDDATFLNPSLFINQINKFFKNKRVHNWDVLLLGGNNIPPYKQIDETCIRVSHCQTTTCYLVNGHYFDTLIENIKQGINNLIREPENSRSYAIDMYWLNLQKKHIWLLIVPLSVIQREDYSDIEQRNTKYQSMMLDLNKECLFNNKNKNDNNKIKIKHLIM